MNGFIHCRTAERPDLELPGVIYQSANLGPDRGQMMCMIIDETDNWNLPFPLDSLLSNDKYLNIKWDKLMGSLDELIKNIFMAVYELSIAADNSYDARKSAFVTIVRSELDWGPSRWLVRTDTDRIHNCLSDLKALPSRLTKAAFYEMARFILKDPVGDYSVARIAGHSVAVECPYPKMLAWNSGLYVDLGGATSDGGNRVPRLSPNLWFAWFAARLVTGLPDPRLIRTLPSMVGSIGYIDSPSSLAHILSIDNLLVYLASNSELAFSFLKAEAGSNYIRYGQVKLGTYWGPIRTGHRSNGEPITTIEEVFSTELQLLALLGLKSSDLGVLSLEPLLVWKFLIDRVGILSDGALVGLRPSNLAPPESSSRCVAIAMIVARKFGWVDELESLEANLPIIRDTDRIYLVGSRNTFESGLGYKVYNRFDLLATCWCLFYLKGFNPLQM